MLVQFNKIYRLLMAGALLVTAGCSDAGNSSFVYGPSTLALIHEAQNGIDDLPGVRKLVDVRFGDPQHLRAWSRLPIDAGGTFGSVAEIPAASDDVKKLKLSFEDSIDLFTDEIHRLQFITGDAAVGEDGPLDVAVISWDSESGIAQLQNKLEVIPAEGDRVILDGGTMLQRGRLLYQRHCSHCHGTSGDGAGPTAGYLRPRPRDYRHGVFKFTRTQAAAKARREDLKRILRNGVPDTYMPSFVPMLAEEELDVVVEYIRFLAMRGEFERRLAAELAADFSDAVVATRVEGGEKRREIVTELNEVLAEDINESLEFVSGSLADAWGESDTEDTLIIPSVPRVPNSLESRQLGRELFLSKDLACSDCHGIDGRGDGPQTTIFEENPVTKEFYDEPGLHDIWDNVNQPRNLTRGVYRGGRRPIDLFSRIHGGIKGTRMPSFKNLEHEKIWHVVNYVLSIPFETEPGRAAAPTNSE